MARSELIWSRTVLAPVRTNSPIVTPFGFYVSGEYQLARRWFLGGRFDRSQRGNCLPTNPPTTTVCDLRLPLNALLQDTFRTYVRGYEEWKISELAKRICAAGERILAEKCLP